MTVQVILLIKQNKHKKVITYPGKYQAMFIKSDTVSIY